MPPVSWGGPFFSSKHDTLCIAALGQKRKSSKRAQRVRFSPESRSDAVITSYRLRVVRTRLPGAPLAG
jgi:hypothetical protein